MNANLRGAVAILFLILGICPPVGGADIFHNEDRVIVIEGEIHPGDFEKFKKLTTLASSSNVGTVYLASPGGNMVEAMKIGLLVRKLRFTTFAPVKAMPRNQVQVYGLKNIDRNNVCASACFMIFVAGAKRLGDKIGIHRPYFAPEFLRSASGDEVIDQSKRGAQIVEAYLKDMDVPAKYVELMFQVPKDQIRWLTANEVEQIPMLIPGLADWIESKCGADPFSPSRKPARGATDREREKWSVYLDKHDDCSFEAMKNMRMSVWEKYMDEEKENRPVRER